MANMPPMRFNYQQRVGRAGRRGTGLSIALTLCRGRSHDDYYFQRPERITAYPPPPPYVDLRRERIFRRVLVKEILRQAFNAIGFLNGASDSVHDEFGDASAWNQQAFGFNIGQSVANVVNEWIQQNGAIVEHICDVLLAFAEPELLSQRASLLIWVRQQLIGSITEIANSQLYTQSALSERLANAGLLPMFGFPTRTRYLLHVDPTHSVDWPSEDSIDRNLDIAISQFAPRSETVKDKIVHTAVGVAHYRKIGGRVREEPNPLGNDILIGTCRNCQAVGMNLTLGSIICPICLTPNFNIIPIVQPRGFRTLFDGGRDFNGIFEWTPRASRPKTDAEPVPMATLANIEYWSDQRNVYIINDNNAQLFQFERLARSESWVTREAVDYVINQTVAMPPQYDRGVAPRKVGLGSIKPTDILVLGIHNIRPEIDISPWRVEGRAALNSYGFLLRRAVSERLDISTLEIDVGLRVTRQNNQIIGQLFLSDSLENGAGYCTHFAEPAELESLLRFIADENDSFLREILADHHSGTCQTSCPDCLRDYANLAWHSILDWRLAVDIARLALDSNAPIDLATPYFHPLVTMIATQYFQALNYNQITLAGLPAGVDRSGLCGEFIVHPLWATNHPTIIQVRSEALAQGITNMQSKTLFEVIRRPFKISQ